MDKTTNKWRVRIAIYDADNQTPDEPEMWTDEPLMTFEPATSMSNQSLRTYNYFINKQASEQ